jgi:hypothetical protein
VRPGCYATISLSGPPPSKLEWNSVRDQSLVCTMAGTDHRPERVKSSPNRGTGNDSTGSGVQIFKQFWGSDVVQSSRLIIALAKCVLRK